jgi:hypothetical protein
MYEKDFEDIIIPVYYTNEAGKITIDEEGMRELFEEELEKRKKEINN